MDKICAVILAAGDGKRMKSAHPKVTCQVLFKPMISWITDSSRAAGIADGCVVVGEGGAEVEQLLPSGFVPVFQAERRGTGHAASMAADFIRTGGYHQVAVLNGDAPFIGADDLLGALELHKTSGNLATVISAQVDDPWGYGRIVRDGQQVTAIVEEKDATDAQRSIREINSGAFWFDAALLLEYFGSMTCDNAQGEYYLPDALAYAIAKGGGAGAYTAGPDTVLGANNRADLSALNALARERQLRLHMDNGVNIPFPDGIVIGADVEIGPDTTILPGTILRGRTVIGRDCEIGPNSYLDSAVIGDGCKVLSTYVDASTLKENVKIGPMSNVRPGCVIEAGAKVGDFVELKNSSVGSGTAVAHLTYIGDSDVGSDCNFGCGVVTVNYDGSKKHRTVIGDNCFIGCNTNLVAPVKVGDRVYAAAGTTVTQDVPTDAMVIGRARQVIKEGWASQRGLFKKK